MKATKWRGFAKSLPGKAMKLSRIRGSARWAAASACSSEPASRSGGGSDAMSERVIDLMVEDQRQTGDTQQQHEGRAVQPDPLMDEVPQV